MDYKEHRTFFYTVINQFDALIAGTIERTNIISHFPNIDAFRIALCKLQFQCWPEADVVARLASIATAMSSCKIRRGCQQHPAVKENISLLVLALFLQVLFSLKCLKLPMRQLVLN